VTLPNLRQSRATLDYQNLQGGLLSVGRSRSFTFGSEF
jgi:hypothetical protein